MKKALAAFLAVLLPCFNTYAWVGGPFDNNSPTPDADDGVYEAVGTLPNGTLLYRWGVGNRATAITYTDGRTGNTSNVQFGAFAGAQNNHVVYFQGGVYYGLCFGTVNSALQTVRCVGTASTLFPQTNFTGTLGGAGVVNPNFATATISTTIGGSTTLITTQVPGNFIANSQFTASMTRDRNGFTGRNPASKEFSGTGQLRVNGNPLVDLLPTNLVGTPFAIGGVSTPRNIVPFFVFGNRVSFLRNG